MPKKYDFGVYENNKIILLVEYDDYQHERFIPYFHKDHEEFEKRKKCYKLKDKYAKDNHYKLIRIKYNDFNNIEIILEAELNIKRKEVI